MPHPSLLETTKVMEEGRYLPLEFLRGFAAIAIFVDHFFLFFMPGISGIYEPEEAREMLNRGESIVGRFLFDTLTPARGSPLFCLFNGTASVHFFFTLSAYVLTSRYFQVKQTRLLIVGCMKRYLRLVGPVVVSVLIAYFLLTLGLYHTEEASKLADSPILQSRGMWSPHMGRIGPNPKEPNFLDAFFEASILTFIRGDSSYLVSMWIITYDLFGAFLAYFLAYLYAKTEFKTMKSGKNIIQICLFIFCHVAPFVGIFSKYSVSFMCGVFMSFFHSQSDAQVSSNVSALLYFLGVFYFLGFYYPKTIYGWVDVVILPLAKLETLRSYFYALGSALLIHVSLRHKWTRTRLSNCRVKGANVAHLFGVYSVGFYFLGVQLAFSFSSFLFMLTYNKLGYSGEFITFVCTFAMLAIAAFLFTKFDSFWAKKVNFIVSKLSKFYSGTAH